MKRPLVVVILALTLLPRMGFPATPDGLLLSSPLRSAELANLAGEAVRESGGEDAVAAVEELAGGGYFDHLAAALARNSGQRISGSELHRLAIGSISTRNQRQRQTFGRLAAAGFFKGPLLETLAHRMAAPQVPSTGWQEVVEPDEPALFAQAAASVNDLQRKFARGGTIRRGFHAKQHAALLAELRVVPDLPAHARHGIFAKSRSYPVWVRFSNGLSSPHADALPDQRGLALKAIGAPSSLLGWPGPKTQDFLLTNNPAFIARNATQFLAMAKFQLGQAGFLETLTREFGLREAKRIAGALARHVRPLRSVAEESYWTGAPHAFGPFAAKLKLEPVPVGPAGPRHIVRPDYLRGELRERLLAADIRFDLVAQFYVDPTRTPIEDATVVWKESDAPCVKLAELVVARRDLESLRARAEHAFGDKLSFTPWHAAADMRPLGNIMRLRRVAYEASARLRGHVQEPSGAERFER